MKINRQTPKGQTIFNLLEPGDVFEVAGGDGVYMKLRHKTPDLLENNSYRLDEPFDAHFQPMQKVIKLEAILTVK